MPVELEAANVTGELSPVAAPEGIGLRSIAQGFAAKTVLLWRQEFGNQACPIRIKPTLASKNSKLASFR